MHFQDERKAANTGDRRNVADEIEIEFFIKGRIDRARRKYQEERVAVRRRTYDCLGGDIATRARPVLDNERLAETLLEPLTNEARRYVSWAAGRSANNDAHRPRRIALRPCSPRQGPQRNSAGGQMQKLSSVGKFHERLLPENIKKACAIALAAQQMLGNARRPMAPTLPEMRRIRHAPWQLD